MKLGIFLRIVPSLVTSLAILPVVPFFIYVRCVLLIAEYTALHLLADPDVNDQSRLGTRGDTKLLYSKITVPYMG